MSNSELFAQALSIEDSDPARAIELYSKLINLDPNYTAAHINIGVLFYKRKAHDKAEKHYRKAIELDLQYVLAYFNLANLLDETGRKDEAIAAYREAIRISPKYADAHYNLALLLSDCDIPASLPHWSAYIKLDRSNGPWVKHARLRKMLLTKKSGFRIVKSKRRKKVVIQPDRVNPGLFLVKK